MIDIKLKPEVRVVNITDTRLSLLSLSAKHNSATSETGKSAISFETQINIQRATDCERKFTQQLISCILEDDFEYGVESRACILVKEQMKINKYATKEWLNRMYVDNFRKPRILIGILRVISRLDKEDVYPVEI
jgi:hypothetical protein